MKILTIAISAFLDGICGQQAPQRDWGSELRQLLDVYSSDYGVIYREHIKNDWNQLTNRTKENFDKFTDSRKRVSVFRSKGQLYVLDLGYKNLYNEYLTPLDQKRMDEVLRIGIDSLVLSDLESTDYSQKFVNLTMLRHKLQLNLDVTTVTVGADELRFTDVQNILNTMYKMPSTFESPCMAYFTQMDFWHGILAKIGRKSRPDFIKLRDLYNEAAAKNGFSGATEELLYEYGSGTDIKSLVSSIWIDIFPLYKKLHSVVRYELAALFTEDLVDVQGAIPAHLMGSIHGDTWENLFELLSPDEEFELLDDEELFMNVKEMVEYVDNMFKDLGFPPMPQDFFENSKFQKLDKSDSCEAGAWDFKSPSADAFRIHMCAINKRQDLRQMIFLFAQAHFYRAYSGLDILLQKPANPSLFHTIPDVIRMFASLHDKHAQHFNMTATTEINYLMYMALKELPFLAFAKSLEEWRWKVFSGEYPESQFQRQWEDIVFENMGLMQPIERDMSDMDPLTKIHILLNIDYAKYFLSSASVYEILASLCPPNSDGRCDLRNDAKRPGTILISAMSKGNTMPWESVYQTLTGSTTISGQALRNYFKPLENYLDKMIESRNLKVGWKKTKPARKKDILPCSAASPCSTLQLLALVLLVLML